MSEPSRDSATIDLIIRLVCIALLIFWTAVLLRPLFTIIAWSVILAVVLYPIFTWMVDRLRVPAALSAVLLTVLGIVILLGPVAWLGLSLIDSLRSIAEGLRSGDISLPPPPDAVKKWPLIGDEIYAFWSLAATNLKAAAAQIGPQLRTLSSAILAFAGSTALGLLKFLGAVIVAGFLLLPGPAMIDSARSALRRITDRHGDEFLDLAGATVRNLARGVIGVAIVQALLAGIGFIAAGVPAAGFFSFLVLILGIAQIGPAIVIVPIVVWSWTTGDTTAALIFTAYMIPVTLLDNVLRPLIMAHGLKTPMLVILIGLIGGVLIHGVIGVFIGPVVLAIGWELLRAWTGVEKPATQEADPPNDSSMADRVVRKN
jgi:predicted PurR-regulated permease PerM